MKRFALFVLLLVFAFSLLGCAGGGLFGGGNSNAGSSNNAGALSVKVNWPAGAKTSILASTYSLKFNVCTPTTNSSGTTVYLREVDASIIKHNAANSTENTTINGIPIGPRTVVVQAYDDTGTEIGYGTTTVTITVGVNGGVTITPALGTFGFDFIGKSDVSVPTESGGGGGGSTTTYSYFFVNNYGAPASSTNGSVSVIRETKTTSGGSSTYSVDLVGTISYNNMKRPCKGVFNTAGTYYYVTNADTNNPSLCKITPNTSSWSSSTVETLYTFPANSLPQEILYINGYLYVGVRYLDGPYAVKVYKINATTGAATFVSIIPPAPFVPGDGIIGLCSISGTNNFIVNFTADGSIIPVYCSENLTLGTNGEWSGPPAASVGMLFYFAVPVMTDANTLYTPTAGIENILGAIFKYTMANTTLTWNSEYAKNVLNFRKFLYYNGTGYALSAVSGGISYIYYSAPPDFSGSKMNTGAYSTSDLADMAFNADKTRIYATDFGMTVGGGSKVFIKVLASPDSFYTPVTVGTSPIGITLKP